MQMNETLDNIERIWSNDEYRTWRLAQLVLNNIIRKKYQFGIIISPDQIDELSKMSNKDFINLLGKGIDPKDTYHSDGSRDGYASIDQWISIKEVISGLKKALVDRKHANFLEMILHLLEKDENSSSLYGIEDEEIMRRIERKYSFV